MIDITQKKDTLREATAQALLKVSVSDTIRAIQEKSVPKGDVFAVSKTAGLLGIKKTPDLLPNCHPIPITQAAIDFHIQGLNITVSCTVSTIYKTGVEVEAMHGASVAALNLYDMLKPLDQGIVIHSIKLISKKGGKSSFEEHFKKELTAAVVVCSDTISQGRKEDQAGKAIIKKLENHRIRIHDYRIIPDDIPQVQKIAMMHQKQGVDLILFIGGTGLSKRDTTPEALSDLIDRPIPGIAEAMRSYGQSRTPYAMLSRSVAGAFKDSLIMALPGSIHGAEESMEAVLPAVLHVFNVFKGRPHDG